MNIGVPEERPPLIPYASAAGEGESLRALKRHGWRVLVSRADRRRPPAGMKYALDNGAWSDFQAGREFDGDAFDGLLDAYGADADWIVLPDIVAGGLASLAMSKRWMNRCLGSGCPLVLIAVQDGMEPDDLAPLVGPNVGIFLGGSTEWKLARAMDWGEFAATRGVYYHFARCNTETRFKLAHDAGANSIDGSSGVKFSKNVPKLTRWARQRSLFNVRDRIRNTAQVSDSFS